MTRTGLLRCTIPFAAILAAAPVLGATCQLSADGARGAQAIGVCKACHTVEAGAKPKITGPSLREVFGRGAAGDAQFGRYSKAMKAAAEKGLVWSDAAIADYVADPKAFLDKLNGTTLPHGMFFQVRDAAVATSIVAYLKEIKDNPACP